MTVVKGPGSPTDATSGAGLPDVEDAENAEGAEDAVVAAPCEGSHDDVSAFAGPPPYEGLTRIEEGLASTAGRGPVSDAGGRVAKVVTEEVIPPDTLMSSADVLIALSSRHQPPPLGRILFETIGAVAAMCIGGMGGVGAIQNALSHSALSAILCLGLGTVSLGLGRTLIIDGAQDLVNLVRRGTVRGQGFYYRAGVDGPVITDYVRQGDSKEERIYPVDHIDATAEKLDGLLFLNGARLFKRRSETSPQNGNTDDGVDYVVELNGITLPKLVHVKDKVGDSMDRLVSEMTDGKITLLLRRNRKTDTYNIIYVWKPFAK